MYSSFIQYIPEIKVRKKKSVYFFKLNLKIVEASRFFKEENVTIIHNILKEEIVIQDKNTQLISVNLTITWKKISSLEFTESMLEAKVKNLEVWCESMKIELQLIYVHQKDPEYICNKLVGLEDRPGICNLQINGVAKRKSLTWE